MTRLPQAARSIDELRRGDVTGLVVVNARVALTEAGRVRLVDETGHLEVELEPSSPCPAAGAWVRCEATWDQGALRGARFALLSSAQADFPSVRGDWTWLRDRDGRRHEILRRRAAMMRAIRSFFDAADFLEVETPLAVPSPGLDVHLDAVEVLGMGEPRWLITSPEYQMKRLLCAGAPRLMQLCKCFRAGEVGARHQPEFTMLEWYRAFAGAEALMRDTEQLVAAVALALLGTTVLPARGEQPALDLSPPWERLTIEDAFVRHAGLRVDEVLPDEDRFFLILSERIEPAIGRAKPTFLTQWPASMASLARLLPDAPHRADRFEAFARGLELCNGFGELTDPIEQRARLERDQGTRRQLGRPVYPIDEKFLDAMEEGMPPAGGNALGADRLLMLLLGLDHIDEAVAFSAGRL